ncbi:WAT1-related protein At5g40240 isoform X3 [Hevea brasiliensis]|uniref:WAT1-related protein At5g40240 isoform X3 n=1 Tax=Hevea brasiliensis TaxID=3981 RepID=UPI0025FB4053|nr:WAT1-related protein At5g40240 isoform X3 [Hevea brasiliensis]
MQSSHVQRDEQVCPYCLLSERPSLTFSILFRIFLLALLGVLSQIFAYVGIEFSSPMLGTAMLNLIPAFTFILAIIFRMEKLDWRSTSSLAKSLGTIVSIAGAFVVTFYKGPSLLKTSSIALWPLQQLLFSKSIWVVGAFLLAAEAFIISAWYILQTLTVRSFPAVFTIMFYSCLFGTILSAFCCLLEVEDASDWQLRLDVGLVAVLYSAIVATVFQSSLCMWCLWKAGPLFVSMFKPLAIIFAVVLDAIFLGENLGLGSLIGATVIVTGFYAVMWGKAKEEYITDDKELGSSGLSVENVRLLQT